MIEHPLIEIINLCDNKLDDFITRQKELHYAFAMGLLTDEQKKHVIEIDDAITDIVHRREDYQRRLFEATKLVILHDWEWDL